MELQRIIIRISRVAVSTNQLTNQPTDRPTIVGTALPHEGVVEVRLHQVSRAVAVLGELRQVVQTPGAVHVQQERQQGRAQLAAGGPRGGGVFEVGHAVPIDRSINREGREVWSNYKGVGSAVVCVLLTNL